MRALAQRLEQDEHAARLRQRQRRAAALPCVICRILWLARYEGGALPDDLVTFARVFQDWRYSYEFSGAYEMDQTGVAHLASALYETCAELRPDLIQPGMVHDRLVAAAQGVPI
jgi:hypothetical protein